MSDELFNVVQYFENDSYEYVRRNVTAEEAGEAFTHYTSSVAVKLGIVKKVVITDQGDEINAEWVYGKGLVFPTKEMIEEETSRMKHGSEGREFEP